MKSNVNYKILFLAIIIIVTLLFILLRIIPSRIDKIESLLNEGNYQGAKILIEKYLIENPDNEDLLKLDLSVSYELIKTQCKIFEINNLFKKAMSLIESNLSRFKNTVYDDSIKISLYDLGLKGAEHYYDEESFLLAYDCIVPLLKNNLSIRREDKYFVNECTKAMLTGIWQAHSKKIDIITELKIKASTIRNFKGELEFHLHKISKQFNYYDLYCYNMNNCNYEDFYITGIYPLRQLFFTQNWWGNILYIKKGTMNIN